MRNCELRLELNNNYRVIFTLTQEKLESFRRMSEKMREEQEREEAKGKKKKKKK